jgi:hypothetical protein
VSYLYTFSPKIRINGGRLLETYAFCRSIYLEEDGKFIKTAD